MAFCFNDKSSVEVVAYAQVLPALTSSYSTFPVPIVTLPACLKQTLAIDAGAADVPVAFVRLGVGSVLSSAGFTNKYAVLFDLSYLTTTKIGVPIG